jgi:2-hydroxy-6-oxonona-2,4-dienedioate hydrolase
MDEARYRKAEHRLWAHEGVTPTEQLLSLARTGATVRVQEVGQGPPIVFIHGAANGGTSWAPLVSRLAGFHSIVLDRPGCALSPPLAKPFEVIEQLADFGDALVPDVLDALGLEHGHVVATSYGGYLALRSAAANPDRVDRLVLLGWSLGAPMAKTPMMMRLAMVPWIGRPLASVPPPERVVKTILKGAGLRQALASGRFTQDMLDQYRSLLRDTDTVRNEIDSVPRFLTPSRGMDERILLPADLLGRVRAPTFLLWGEEDPMAGPDLARSFAAQIPTASLELMPGAGHAVWIDDPDHVGTVTARFLAG